jgi:hypothetical protein
VLYIVKGRDLGDAKLSRKRPVDGRLDEKSALLRRPVDGRLEKKSTLLRRPVDGRLEEKSTVTGALPYSEYGPRERSATLVETECVTLRGTERIESFAI